MTMVTVMVVLKTAASGFRLYTTGARSSLASTEMTEKRSNPMSDRIGVVNRAMRNNNDVLLHNHRLMLQEDIDFVKTLIRATLRRLRRDTGKDTRI